MLGLTHGPEILLTGATGAVGAHVLARLLDKSRVEKGFWLIRRGSPLSRLHSSMKERRLSVMDPTKLSVHIRDLSQPDLDLDKRDQIVLLSQITHIIHCASPVNFRPGLLSFEPHIAGVRNLM